MSMEEEVDRLRGSIEEVKKTINRSHGEIGLGVLLAVTFTFANTLISSHVWEQVPPWRQLTWYNCIITLLCFMWLIVALYAILSRWKHKQENDGSPEH